MKDKSETRKLAVRIGAVKPDYNYGHQTFEYYIVTLDQTGKVRNCSDSDDFSADFDDLMFRCQISSTMNELKPYAYSCEYRSVYSLDLRKAERCVKVLRKIDKAGEKFPVRPETFGQYVQMLAHALGIDAIVQEPLESRASSWHDETAYQTWKLADCQWLIDRQISDFVTEHGKRMAEVSR